MAQEVGLLIAQAVLEEEVQRKIASNPGSLYRWGFEPGSVVLGGQKLPIRRPRLRQQGREVPLESYDYLRDSGRLQQAVHGQVVRGLSTRNYANALEETGRSWGLRRSSVSRQFKVISAQQLAELCARPLGDLRLVALLIDGKVYKEQTVVVALGIDETGHKHVLGLWDGATENAAVCQALLDDLLRRGLDPQRRYLAVLDGSKALAKAVKQTLGTQTPIQRCQFHKKRNVSDHLPGKWQGTARQRLSAAYGMKHYAEALSALKKTVAWLATLSEGAGRSLEEGLEETLTVHRLSLPDILRRSLATTNVIESCFGHIEHLTRNVKRWRNGSMVLRWVGTMLLEAEKKFRRIRGYQALPALTSALQSWGKLPSSAASA
jgi:transposase-like protein